MATASPAADLFRVIATRANGSQYVAQRAGTEQQTNELIAELTGKGESADVQPIALPDPQEADAAVLADHFYTFVETDRHGEEKADGIYASEFDCGAASITRSSPQRLRIERRPFVPLDDDKRYRVVESEGGLDTLTLIGKPASLVGLPAGLQIQAEFYDDPLLDRAAAMALAAQENRERLENFAAGETEWTNDRDREGIYWSAVIELGQQVEKRLVMVSVDAGKVGEEQGWLERPIRMAVPTADERAVHTIPADLLAAVVAAAKGGAA